MNIKLLLKAVMLTIIDFIGLILCFAIAYALIKAYYLYAFIPIIAICFAVKSWKFYNERKEND